MKRREFLKSLLVGTGAVALNLSLPAISHRERVVLKSGEIPRLFQEGVAKLFAQEYAQHKKYDSIFKAIT
jgi:hypothetical protein